MTCIIGVVEGGRVYMGGDSGAVNGWLTSTITERKVVRCRNILIGHAGTPRLGQMAELMTFERGIRGETPFAYMVEVFIPALQKVVEAGKFDWNSDDNESSLLLIGFRGALFTVCNDYSVNTYADGLVVIGARDMGLGAMAALESSEPEARILQSLEIVGRFVKAIRPPYYVEVLE